MSKKILIVDDESNTVLPLDFLMKREGFEGFMAGDAKLRWRRSTCSGRIGALGNPLG